MFHGLMTMDDAQLDRSIRSAALLIGAVLLLVFGIEFLVSGVVDLAVECTSMSFNQACSGSQLWQLLAPVISGAIEVGLSIVFFVLASRSRLGLASPAPPR